MGSFWGLFPVGGRRGRGEGGVLCYGSVRTCSCPVGGCWVPMNVGSLPFWWRLFGNGFELLPMVVGSVPHWGVIFGGHFLLLVRVVPDCCWQRATF